MIHLRSYSSDLNDREWQILELLLMVALEIVVALKMRNTPPSIPAILLLNVPPLIFAEFGLPAHVPPRPPKLVAVRASLKLK